MSIIDGLCLYVIAEAKNIASDFTRQVRDVLEFYCNTFSEREKRQNAKVQKFKDAVCATEN